MLARKVRRFNLERDVDVSGVSGTGAVAYGVQAPNGTCVLWWDSEHESIGIYPSMDTVLAIHGHSGSTRAVFLDDPAELAEQAAAPTRAGGAKPAGSAKQPAGQRRAKAANRAPSRAPAAGRASGVAAPAVRRAAGTAHQLPAARGGASARPGARTAAVVADAEAAPARS